jgi:hypothetical protein
MEKNSSSSSPIRKGYPYLYGMTIALILLSYVSLLLTSCATSTKQQGSTPTPTSPGNSLTTPSPSLLTQQYQFTAQDSGRTLIYPVTSRFGIILNAQQYPKKQFQVSCFPAGTLGSISNIPAVAPPLYAVRYEGVKPGTCIIKNGNFHLTVIIVPYSGA